MIVLRTEITNVQLSPHVSHSAVARRGGRGWARSPQKWSLTPQAGWPRPRQPGPAQRAAARLRETHCVFTARCHTTHHYTAYTTLDTTHTQHYSRIKVILLLAYLLFCNKKYAPINTSNISHRTSHCWKIMSGSESKRKMSKRITGRQNSKDQILNFCAALCNTIAIHITSVLTSTVASTTSRPGLSGHIPRLRRSAARSNTCYSAAERGRHLGTGADLSQYLKHKMQL